MILLQYVENQAGYDLEASFCWLEFEVVEGALQVARKEWWVWW